MNLYILYCLLNLSRCTCVSAFFMIENLLSLNLILQLSSDTLRLNFTYKEMFRL